MFTSTTVTAFLLFVSNVLATPVTTHVEPLVRSERRHQTSTHSNRLPAHPPFGHGSAMTSPTEFGLQKSQSFYWGPAGLPIANLTAHAGDDTVRILSMERFGGLLQQSKCSANSVEFHVKKDAQFDKIKEEWSWVNSAQSNYIVLVTENAQCNMPDGDPSERQPWHITGADFDAANNLITLSAEPKTWKQAFNSWNLKVSSKGLPQARHTKRSLDKRLRVDKSLSLDMAHTLPSYPISFTSSSQFVAQIACTDCYTTGSLNFDIDVSYHLFSGLSGTATMTPESLAAYITTQVKVGQKITWTPINVPLFEFDADGLDIPGIVDIGPTFKVLFQAGVSATALVDVTMGAIMTISDDATAELDFDDSSNDQVSGWEPSFTPNIPANPIQAEVDLKAFAQLQFRVEFDIEVFESGLTAGISLNAPAFNAVTKGIYNPDGGICAGSDSEFAVEFEVDIGVEVDLYAGVGGPGAQPNKLEIFTTSYDFFSTCIPVATGSPGSGSALPSLSPTGSGGNITAANATVTPSAPPRVPMSSIIANVTSSAPPKVPTSSIFAPTGTAPTGTAPMGTAPVGTAPAGTGAAPGSIPSSAPTSFSTAPFTNSSVPASTSMWSYPNAGTTGRRN